MPEVRTRHYSCFSFSYHNFKDTVINFDKDMFRKESFCGTNFYSSMKITLKKYCYLFSTIEPCLHLLVVFLRKNVKKLLRNSEYSKSQKAKKL